jgi:hypothetical protein
VSILSIAGPTEQENATVETAKSSLRAELVKRIALGGGWSVGAAIVFGAFELIRSEPHEAFPLLKSWGPWAIVSIVALYVLYDVVRMALNIGMRMVQAVEKLAVAQQKSADKDDRQVQEIQTLTALTAQRSEKTYAMLQQYHEGLQESLKRVEDKIDNKLAGAEKSTT